MQHQYSSQYSSQYSKGFSIIEILIALAVVSVLFTVVARAIGAGGKGLTTLLSHSELLEDTRYAGELIHSNLQNSVYVYPPQTKLTLNTNADYHTRNPNTGDNTWVVGQDPIIAMIVAPKTGLTTCSADPNACLSFVAYYTVKRSDVTTNSGLSYEGGSLPTDAHNPDALMIFEYSKALDVTTLSDTVPPPTGPEINSSAGRLKDVTARLVADYINPNNGFALTIDNKNATEKVKSCQIGKNSRIACPTAGESPLTLNYKITMALGNIKISSFYAKGKKTFETPELEFSFSPRNLY